MEEIDRWHKERGWKGIGYNIVISNGVLKPDLKYIPDFDGLIFEGRKLDFNTYLDGIETGAHAYGFNSSSIGVCLIGDYFFTKKQFDSLYFFVSLWRRIIPSIEVLGHCDLPDVKKSCPNFDVKHFMEMVSLSHISLSQRWDDMPINFGG